MDFSKPAAQAEIVWLRAYSLCDPAFSTGPSGLAKPLG